MNLLWISVVFCLIATGACQSSSLLLSTVDAQWNFTIAVDPAGTVSFTRNSSPYAVLQNLACTVGQYPQFDGSAWVCGTNLTLTTDPLGALSSVCYSSGASGLQNVPSYNGTSSSFSSCAADSDALGLLTTCSSGQLPVYGAAGAPTCASDSDLASAAATSCGATAGTPKFGSNTTFACGLNLTDTDTAQSLLSSCSDGQLARYNGTAWNCDWDYDLLSSPCADGQLIAATNVSWACAADADALGQLIPSCTGTKDTPQYTTSGGWICIPSPVISLSAPIAQTMVTATYLLPSKSWVPSSNNYTGLSGIPYYFTNGTTVKSWTIRNLSSTTNLTAALWAGSTALSTQTLNSFSYYYEEVIASAVSPGLVGVQFYNAANFPVTVSVDILVELSLV